MVVLGIDIGGSSVKAAVLDGTRVPARSRSGSYARPDELTLREAVVEAVRQAAPGFSGRSPDAVGLCVPGILESGAGVISKSVNVPGIVGVPLQGLVRDAVAAAIGAGSEVRAPVVVSDALAATYDLVMGRRLSGRVLGISIGTGVGAAVLDDGVPLRVSGESSGHFGQLDVTLDEDDPATPIGPDGGRGGLEGYIGAAALIARYGRDRVESGLAGLAASDPPLKALARSIRIAHAIYRPQHIVLAGGIGVRLAPAIPSLRNVVSTSLTSLARTGWSLQAGDDEHHAAVGAAVGR